MELMHQKPHYCGEHTYQVRKTLGRQSPQEFLYKPQVGNSQFCLKQNLYPVGNAISGACLPLKQTRNSISTVVELYKLGLQGRYPSVILDRSSELHLSFPPPATSVLQKICHDRARVIFSTPCWPR